MKRTTCLYVTLLATSMLLPSACTDKFNDEENNPPSWLNENIYDYLKNRGDCNYYVRLIDDCGYTQTMQKTGSNTIFFSKDSTFDAFFANNSQGIRSYEGLSSTFKNMLLRTGIISNAQLIERLSKNDQGNIIFRRTTSLEPKDTIPYVSASTLPDNSYFSSLRSKGGSLYLLQDNTYQTLVQFFPDVMDAKKIYDSDYKFITGRDRTAKAASLFDNEIVKSDITCKNGYLHELKDMLIVPYNMEQYIRKSSNLSVFGKLMTRFSEPVDSKLRVGNDTVWTMRYFNNDSYEGSALTKDAKGQAVTNYLYYDPGWNLYTAEATSNGQSGYQKDMAVMFVPSDSAMNAYLSPDGEGSDLYASYPTWASLPDNIAADYVKNHQLYSFLSSLPHNFPTLKDEAGYFMNVTEADIDHTFVGRNGVVYVTKKVFPPLDYKSVMGPAKMNPNNSIFRMGMEDAYCQFQYYLRSLKSTYLLLISPNTAMKGYVDPVSLGYNTNEHCYWDFFVNDRGTISATPYSIATGEVIQKFTSSTALSTLATNGEISDVSVIKNRLQDILDTHTLVLKNGVSAFESAVDGGQEWFISKGYAPVHVSGYKSGASVYGSGNSSVKNVQTRYDKSNGISLVVDGIVQNTTKSVYETLSSNPEFKDFFDLCNAMDFFETAPSNESHALNYRVKFFGQYHYTIYVPTNNAIEAAQAAGVIPTLSQIESETDETQKEALMEKLKKFLRYHFQDEAVMDKGEALNGETMLSATLNTSNNQFYPLYITNTTAASHSGGKITVTNNKKTITATVSSDANLHNLVARDIVVNRSALTNATLIETYAFAVIHQIDKVLNFE